MHNPKLAGRLHRIGVPTLVVWGAHDGIVPPAYGKEYCALIPGARMKVFDRSGHAPQVEQPGEFIAEIVDFAAPAAV
jgi:pimeloyl-ACP methyl ester carboxylesterase